MVVKQNTGVAKNNSSGHRENVFVTVAYKINNVRE